MNIALFGGTTEGRLIAEAFAGSKLNIHICAATEYGSSLIEEAENIIVHTGRMDSDEIEGFLLEIEADCCVDATHPYACEVSINISNACKNTCTEYIRVTRNDEKINDGNVIYADSIEEAVTFLNNTRGNILIATGSKNIEDYIALVDYSKRCFVRILPSAEAVDKCINLGFEAKRLICMQGPFSTELNKAIISSINAKWLVTKSSGSTGGFYEKISAASETGIGVIIIGRSVDEKGMTLNMTLDYLQKKYSNLIKRRINVIGMGLGNEKLMTRSALECLNKCDLIIGGERILEIYKDYNKKPYLISYKKSEIVNYIKTHTQYMNIGLLYSGDIGFYSGAKGINELLSEFEIKYYPGISSPLYFADILGIPWENIRLVSCHGRKVNIIPIINRNKYVCAITGSGEGLKNISEGLLKYGMNDIKIYVGERLSYSDEKIYTGFPKDFTDSKTDTLTVLLFENKNPHTTLYGEIRDSDIIRGKVPMTKAEIRNISISKLGLEKGSVLYDIGAGTGSVSVAAAIIDESVSVYAIEKKKEALKLINENKMKFRAENIEIVEGEAPFENDNLPPPTHAFIGGSSGKMEKIIEWILTKNKHTRFVINAASLETIGEVTGLMTKYNIEVVAVNASRSKKVGSYNMMSAENPVYIFSFGGNINE